MARLDDIVTATVNLTGDPLTGLGFGKIAILSHGSVASAWVERSREYSNIAAVAADHAATSPEYLAAAACFAQQPRPRKVKILRGSQQKPTQEYTVAVATVANSTVYKIRVGATEVSYTSDATATNDEIITGLNAAIGAISGFTLSTPGAPGATTLNILANAAGNWVQVENTGAYDLPTPLLTITQIHAAPTVATDLNAIIAEDDDWYWLLTLYNSEAYIKAIAAWVETQTKYYLCASLDTTIPGTAAPGTDVFADLKTSAYKRTAGVYHPSVDDFADAAWTGRLAPLTIGSWTAAYHTLSGVTGYLLSDTGIGRVEAKNGTHYTAIGGSYRTQFGPSAAGGASWIDVIVGRDWLISRIQTEIAGLLLAASDAGKKIPYTAEGVAQIEAKLRGVLREAVRVGLISDDYVVEPGDPADAATDDRTARTYTLMSFTATLQGAIHTVEITGNLTT